VPDKRVLSSIKIINNTKYCVSIIIRCPKKNYATYYLKCSASILPPQSTHWLYVTMEEKEDAVKDMQFNDELFVFYSFVDEDIKASDLK
jgi:hypothetical protein